MAVYQLNRVFAQLRVLIIGELKARSILAYGFLRQNPTSNCYKEKLNSAFYAHMAYL